MWGSLQRSNASQAALRLDRAGTLMFRALRAGEGVRSEHMVQSPMLRLFAGVILLVVAPNASGATVTGIVKDAGGEPIQHARIDHTGKRVLVDPADVLMEPSAGEIRSDAEGKFRVVTDVPAIVIRSPGYESQRVRITGDVQLEVKLRRIRSISRCKLSAEPAFKTK